MNLICPFAVQVPGPPENVYEYVNTFHGAILHSSEGHWSASYGPRDTMVQRGVSWHFSVYADGRIEQHYALDRSCWHAGNKAANLRLVGIEHEGVEGEPLTEAQRAASVRLVRWIAQQGAWDGLQREGNLFEHREFSSTTCPNGRIPWEFYTEEEEVQLESLNQSDAIKEVIEAAQAVGPDEGQWFRIVGGYTPKPGRTAYLVEIVE